MSESKQLETLLSKGKITRREFVTRLTAMGIAASISPILLSRSANAATPKKGGRFVMGMAPGHTNDSLDPTTFTENQHYTMGWQLCNNLVEVDHTGAAIPELAESWEPSQDAKQWTFKLRKGVTFHNGKSMTSEDVLYSINLHRGEDSKSAAKGLLASVKDIKAAGKYGVVFNLDSGNADFPYILSDYHYIVVPAGTKGADFDKGVGTGGYVLEFTRTGRKNSDQAQSQLLESGPSALRRNRDALYQ